MYHDVLLQIVIICNYAFIDWGIVYDYHAHDRFLFSSFSSSSSSIYCGYHTQYRFMSSFLSSSSSSSSASLLFFFLPSFGFFFTKILFFFCFLLGFLHFPYKYVLYLFFYKYVKYCIGQMYMIFDWTTLRYSMYYTNYEVLYVKYGYVNNHVYVVVPFGSGS